MHGPMMRVERACGDVVVMVAEQYEGPAVIEWRTYGATRAEPTTALVGLTSLRGLSQASAMAELDRLVAVYERAGR